MNNVEEEKKVNISTVTSFNPNENNENIYAIRIKGKNMDFLWPADIFRPLIKEKITNKKVSIIFETKMNNKIPRYIVMDDVVYVNKK